MNKANLKKQVREIEKKLSQCKSISEENELLLEQIRLLRLVYEISAPPDTKKHVFQ